jgi:hypothetical protein
VIQGAKYSKELEINNVIGYVCSRNFSPILYVSVEKYEK